MKTYLEICAIKYIFITMLWSLVRDYGVYTENIVSYKRVRAKRIFIFSCITEYVVTSVHSKKIGVTNFRIELLQKQLGILLEKYTRK